MNNRIRIARTDNLQNITDPNSLNTVLAEGQPFYDKASQMLFIGDGTTNISQLKADSTKGITSSNVQNSINNVPISDIIESDGTTVKNATEALNFAFDLHITSQEEFNNMISSDTWLNAQSVLLDGQFTLTSPIAIPYNILYIKGINNASITLNNLTSENAISGLTSSSQGYKQTYFIDNVSFNIRTAGQASIDSFVGIDLGFSTLTNCHINITYTGNAFSTVTGVNCSTLINCTVIVLSSTLGVTPEPTTASNIIVCTLNSNNNITSNWTRSQSLVEINQKSDTYIWIGSESQFNSLSSKDDNTLYFVTL